MLARIRFEFLVLSVSPCSLELSFSLSPPPSAGDTERRLRRRGEGGRHHGRAQGAGGRRRRRGEADQRGLLPQPRRPDGPPAPLPRQPPQPRRRPPPRCQEVARRAPRQGHAGQLLVVLQKEVQGRLRVAGPEGRRPHHARLRQRVRAQGLLRRPGNTASSLRPSAEKDLFFRREETRGRGRRGGHAVQRRSEPPRGGGADAGLGRELPEASASPAAAAAAACGPGGFARRLRVGAPQHGPVQGR